MLKKLTSRQKGALFLFGITSFIWFMIGINNNDDGLLYILIISIILGAVTTLVLGILYAFIKSTFDW